MASTAAKVKDKLHRAVHPASHRKACVATSDATAENIGGDAAFAEAYKGNDTAADDAVPPSSEPEPEPEPELPRRRASTPDGSLASKYKLRITAGPSYDTSTHSTVTVNSPAAHRITSSHLHAKLKVRIRSYTGLPLSSPSHTPYFDDPLHGKDRYSIAFSFVPRTGFSAADCVWGPDFDHPVRERLPPGFGTAVGIVKRWIDPGIECDAYADEPWLYGPALSCWFALRVGEKMKVGEGEGGGGGDAWAFPQVEEEDVLEEGADGSGVEVRERVGMPDDAGKRRKFFLDRANRERFEFEKGRVYMADFFNPYLDFNAFALKIPGFSLGVLKYIDDKTHALRWVFKNKTTGDVYFVVVFNLLFGEELEDALREEEEEEGEEGQGQQGQQGQKGQREQVKN